MTSMFWVGVIYRLCYWRVLLTENMPGCGTLEHLSGYVQKARQNGSGGWETPGLGTDLVVSTPVQGVLKGSQAGGRSEAREWCGPQQSEKHQPLRRRKPGLLLLMAARREFQPKAAYKKQFCKEKTEIYSITRTLPLKRCEHQIQ